MQWTTKTERVGVENSNSQLLNEFRQRLNKRGARGIFGLQRVFRVIDDDNSGSLDMQEFWKACCDFRLKISHEECQALFDIFDRNGDGEISYEEFISTISGELNARRKAIVTEAFRKLDRNGDGEINVHDL